MADVTDAQVEARARELWADLHDRMGWNNPMPWEKLGDHMKVMFRDEARAELEATDEAGK